MRLGFQPRVIPSYGWTCDAEKYSFARPFFDAAAMNPIDALLAVIVLLGAVTGSRKGFVVGALHLLTLGISLGLAFTGYRQVAALLQQYAPLLGVWLFPLSFLSAFIVSDVILGAAASAVIGAVPRHVHAAAANRTLGVLPGFFNGLINATVLSLIVLSMPVLDRYGQVHDSRIATRLSPPAEWIEAKMGPIFEPAVERAVEALTVQPESRTRVQLPFKVAAPQVRPDLEARMLEMVNLERTKQGLQPLKADPELTEVARAHSRDMFARGYFSHVNPDGRDAFDRMREGHVRFLTAGENLALASTVTAAHRGLMNSPGHRANVLRPQFGRLGVGVLEGGRHGVMVTEEFRN
jgi:uncharacterized protein YkwD